MKYRTWDEIENSKEEYEKKAMSYYNWLIENRITVNNNEDLKSYIEKTEVYYAQYYSKDSGFTTDDLNNYENGLKATKRQLDECITNDLSARNKNYNVTTFLSYYAKMRQLETMVRKSKTILDKQEKVRELFGDFSVVNNKIVKKQIIRTSKTSQELIEERNARLAILNDLHHEGTLIEECMK